LFNFNRRDQKGPIFYKQKFEECACFLSDTNEAFISNDHWHKLPKVVIAAVQKNHFTLEKPKSIYGLFALEKILKGRLIGCYTG